MVRVQFSILFKLIVEFLIEPDLKALAMKRLLFVVFLLSPLFGFTQGTSMYYPFVEGASYKLVSTNKKGKQTSSEIHKIISVQSTPSGIKGTVECATFDPKNKPLAKFTYLVDINDKTTKIDWRSRFGGIQNAVPAPLMQEGSPCYLELPNNPQVGETFPDCVISYEKGKATYEAKFSEIKIAAKESINVDGTSYKAFVLEYRFLTKIREGLKVDFEKYHKDWYVPGKGMIKSSSPNSSWTPKPTDEPSFFTELVSN